MKKTLCPLILLLLISQAVISQPAAGLNSKALNRALARNGINDISRLKEIIPEAGSGLLPEPQGKYYFVSGTEDEPPGYIYTGRVFTCRPGGCSVSINGESATTGAEYFDYHIIFDSDKRVNMVKVFNYQATHGYEISARGWLRQFRGYADRRSDKLTKDIDAISGATISVNAIINDIIVVTEVLENNINPPYPQK